MRWFLSVCSLALLLAFPTSATESPAGLDVNDVSVLFAKGQGGTFLPDLRLSTTTSTSQLLPKSTFDQVITFGKSVQVDFFGIPETRDVWSVTGFRYDPCFKPNQRSACIRQLRLIAVPVFEGSDVDFAIHLTYQLGMGLPTGSDPVLKDLVALKRASLVSTNGVPLGVHPGLANGQDPDLKLHVRDFLIKHLSAQKLSVITFMGLPRASGRWIFFGGTVNQMRWTPMIVPSFSLTSDVRSMEFFVPGDRAHTPAPPGLSTVPLFKPNFMAPNATPTQRDVVHVIENPTLTHFEQTDCVSCHTTTPRMRFLHIADSANRYRTPTRVTGYPQSSDLQNDDGFDYNLRNFGYFMGRASVSMRTVNESALIANLINTQVLHLRNPGRDCSQADEQVWGCFINEEPDCLRFCHP